MAQANCHRFHSAMCLRLGCGNALNEITAATQLHPIPTGHFDLSKYSAVIGYRASLLFCSNPQHWVKVLSTLIASRHLWSLFNLFAVTHGKEQEWKSLRAISSAKRRSSNWGSFSKKQSNDSGVHPSGASVYCISTGTHIPLTASDHVGPRLCHMFPTLRALKHRALSCHQRQ